MKFEHVQYPFVFLTLMLACSCTHRPAVSKKEDKLTIIRSHIQGKWVLEDDSTNILIIDNKTIKSITEIGVDTLLYTISDTCRTPFENEKVELTESQSCLNSFLHGELVQVEIIQNLTDSMLSLNPPATNLRYTFGAGINCVLQSRYKIIAGPSNQL